MAENIVKSWFVESFDRRVIEKIVVFFLVRHMQWRATPPRTIFSLATVYTTYATGKFVVQSQKQSIGTEGVIQSSRVKYLGWYRTLHNLKI
jgi:hypothetical protein